MLQLPTQALEARIKEEIEINPALEEGRESEERERDNEADDQLGEELSDVEQEFDFSDYMDDDDPPEYQYNANNYSKDDDDQTIPIGSSTTFHDRLIEQLHLRQMDDKHLLILINKHLLLL